VKSARGQAGGYTLARPLDRIKVSEAMAALGGRLYEPTFCHQHHGSEEVCTRSIDCSIRYLWRSVQESVDRLLSVTTLGDLLPKESAPAAPEPVQLTSIQLQ